MKVSCGIVPFPSNEIRQCGCKPTAQVEDVCMGHPNLFQKQPSPESEQRGGEFIRKFLIGTYCSIPCGKTIVQEGTIE